MQQQQRQDHDAAESMKELSPSDMLILLGEEAARLDRVEQKILNQLHSLQVEEELLMRMLKSSETGETQREAASNENNGEALSEDEGTSTMDDLDKELEEALEMNLDDSNCNKTQDDDYNETEDLPRKSKIGDEVKTRNAGKKALRMKKQKILLKDRDGV